MIERAGARPRGATAVEIVVFKAGKLAGTYLFTPESAPIILGRGQAASLRLDDTTVSTKHAAVHFAGRACVIEDCGSRAGVSVNGARVENRIIQPTDEIGIGPFTLRFVLHSAEADAVPQTFDTGEVTVIAPRRSVREDDTEPTSAIAPQEPELSEVREPSKTQEGVGAFAGSLDQVTDQVPVVPWVLEGEEDEDDAPFEPQFSLADRLAEHIWEIDRAQDVVVEAVLCRGDRVVDVWHLGPGQDLGGLCSHEEQGRLLVALAEASEVRVERDGQPVDPGTLAQPGPAPKLVLAPGMRATVTRGEERLHVRFAPAYRSSGRGPIRLAPPRSGAVVTLGSVGVHIAVFLALAFSGERQAGGVTVDDSRFARIGTTDLELPPLPEPEPQKPATPIEAPVPASELTTISTGSVKPAAHAKRSASRQVKTERPSGSSASGQLAAALTSSLPSASSASVTAASATNLDASLARGTSAGFKSAGTIGKVAGGELSVPSGGGTGGARTRTMTEVAAGGDGAPGAVHGASGGGGVRGVVKSAPVRSVEVEGELDRSEIQRVVNVHLAAVQACYERKLIKEPGLSGKIVFEWVITPSGSVGVVRVKSSSVRNSEVATCIQASIRQWQFPKPRGGSVTVKYPFNFAVL